MEPARPSARRWYAAVVLGIVALVFLAVSMPRIAAPFGDSDEGINGAVWATNSRALREDGIVDSRLGGRRSDGTSYATHPPYIVISTAVAETIGGENAWASRIPAWLATIASIGLLYLLVRRTGVGGSAAATAVAAAFLSPMVFAYGFMLDTPVVSLPFGIAVLIAWTAQWRAPAGSFAWHPLAIGALCAGAALAGWQAAVLTALAGLSLAVRRFRGREHGIADALPFLIGGAIGVVLSLSWTWWVYGDFAILGDKFFRRSGESSSVGLGDMASFQIPWLAQLLGLGLIGMLACIRAAWDERMRPVAAMSLAIVVVYAIVFRQAAAGHQYWNYWALIPATVGYAWMFDRLRRDLAPRAVVPVLAISCVAIGAVNLLVLQDDALRYIDEGHEVAEAVIATPLPSDQSVVPYVGPAYRPDAWIRYYTGLPAQQIGSTAMLDDLARTRPDDITVVLGWCDESDPSAELCREVVGPTDGSPRPRVAPAREIAPSG
jgi:4-amino-4-deoxy-L-arabinose transferase-like glycosyltransferase